MPWAWGIFLSILKEWGTLWDARAMIKLTRFLNTKKKERLARQEKESGGVINFGPFFSLSLLAQWKLSSFCLSQKQEGGLLIFRHIGVSSLSSWAAETESGFGKTNSSTKENWEGTVGLQMLLWRVTIMLKNNEMMDISLEALLVCKTTSRQEDKEEHTKSIWAEFYSSCWQGLIIRVS